MRFMAVDPRPSGIRFGQSQSWNLYAYVDNNPLRYKDPTGQSKIEDWLERTPWGQRILGSVWGLAKFAGSRPATALEALSAMNSPVAANDQYVYDLHVTQVRVYDQGYSIDVKTGLLFNSLGFQDLPFSASKNGFGDPNGYANQDLDGDGDPNSTDPDIDGDGTPNQRDPDPFDRSFGGSRGEGDGEQGGGKILGPDNDPGEQSDPEEEKNKRSFINRRPLRR